jgi:methyltransferase family protein
MVGKYPATAGAWAVVLSILLPTAVGGSASPAIAERSRPAPPRIDVLFEPTPHAIVDAMLRLAKVGPDDFLIDLGSGDGRIPIAAARTYGAKALGVDVDPRRVREARENAERRGVVGKVSFVEGDLFGTDIGGATVVALFLSPEANRRLRPRLLDLPPGTRIVSHEHDMGSWQPDRTAAGRSLGGHRLFSWVVPAKVDGGWRLRVGEREIDVRIRQSYQRFDGSATVDGGSYPIRNGRLSGAEISLDLPLGGDTWRRLRGHVTPSGEMRGEGWDAKRQG